jgi:hypothetical protein
MQAFDAIREACWADLIIARPIVIAGLAHHCRPSIALRYRRP